MESQPAGLPAVCALPPSRRRWVFVSCPHAQTVTRTPPSTLLLPKRWSRIRALKRGISFPNSLNLLGFKGLEGKPGLDPVSRHVCNLPAVPSVGKVEQTPQESDQRVVVPLKNDSSGESRWRLPNAGWRRSHRIHPLVSISCCQRQRQPNACGCRLHRRGEGQPFD